MCKSQKPKNKTPPPSNSNCWQWWTPPPNGIVTFDILQPPTGCDYEPCERAVCACDPYCCEQAWDLSCRGYYMKKSDTQRNNYFVKGCNASELCCEDEFSFPKPAAALPPPKNIEYNVYLEVQSTNKKKQKVVQQQIPAPVSTVQYVYHTKTQTVVHESKKSSGSRRRKLEERKLDW